VSVHGTAAADIWTVGSQGTIAHFGGTEWVLQDSPTTETLTGVWAGDAHGAWAVGNRGTIVHWNGTGWSLADSPTASNLAGMWGSSIDDVWAVGDGGTILHLEGTVWSLFGSPTGRNLNAIWGTSPKDVRIGGGWTETDSYDREREHTTAWKWDGENWSELSVGFAFAPFAQETNCLQNSRMSGAQKPNRVGVTAIRGTAANAVWFATRCSGREVIWTGDSHVSSEMTVLGQYGLLGLWGTSNTDLWAVGEYGGMAHFDGKQWSRCNSPTSASSYNAIWGSSVNDVWVVGARGVILHRQW
jgi:hypothetical protein